MFFRLKQIKKDRTNKYHGGDIQRCVSYSQLISVESERASEDDTEVSESDRRDYMLTFSI